MMAIVQVRGLPDETVRRLKARAASEGKSLSEYLRDELESLAARPTLEEILDRVARLEPVVGGESSAEAIRREREAREKRLAADDRR